MSRAHATANLIHQNDCIAIITQIIEEDITAEIFNAVADGHPIRDAYYSNIALEMGLEVPEFKTDEKPENHKVVSNAKLKQKLSYIFTHPNLC